MDELTRLEVAFGLHMMRLVADADEILDLDEMQVMERTYPSAMLRDVGFLDDQHRFTDAYDEARMEALERLPVELDVSRRIQLVADLYQAATGDDDLDPRELQVMQEAAGLLGLSWEAVSAFLDQEAVGPGGDVPPVRS